MSIKVANAVMGLNKLINTYKNDTGVTYPFEGAVKVLILKYKMGEKNKKEILFYYDDFYHFVYNKFPSH